MFSPVALGAPVSPLILIIPLILVVAIIKTANDYIRKKHIEYLLFSIVFLLLSHSLSEFFHSISFYEIFPPIPLWVDEKIKEDSQSITLNPAETREILVSFILEQESGYHFTIIIDGKEVYTQPNSFPPRLRAS